MTPTFVGGAREPDLWSLRLVGLCLNRRELEIPQPFTVTPQGDLESLCSVRDARPRVLRLHSTNPTFAVFACVVIVPSRLRDCSLHPTLLDGSRGLPRSPSVRSAGRCLLRVSKDRPSTVSGAEESASCVDVAAVALEKGCQPLSRSACVVFHHLGESLLLDPARVFHRASSHGVRDVSSPRQRIPITCSCPAKLFSGCVAGTVWISPFDAGPASPSPVSRVGSPRALPPRS